MRISDWSSDVCSSDLHGSDEGFICGQAIMGLPKSMRVDGKMRLCIVSARQQERAFTILLPDFRFDPVRQGEDFLSVSRSEERRVGKECVSPCRSRWWTIHSKKKYVRVSHISRHK